MEIPLKLPSFCYRTIQQYTLIQRSDMRIITFLMHKFHHAIPLDSCLQEYALLLQMIDLIVLLPVTWR